MSRITIITASGGKNLELAKKFEEKLLSLGAQVHILNLLEMDLPLYTSINEFKFQAKDLLGEWLDVLIKSSGFVFLAPEYNGGTPPLFTNFLAWVSRASKNWREAFNEKSAVIGTHSGGGGQSVLMSMRMQLSFIGINVLGRQVLTHSSKPLEEESLNAVCRQLLAHSQVGK